MTSGALGRFCLWEPFLHKKILKIIFEDCVVMKISIIQPGLYSFSNSSFKMYQNIFMGP